MLWHGFQYPVQVPISYPRQLFRIPFGALILVYHHSPDTVYEVMPADHASCSTVLLFHEVVDVGQRALGVGICVHLGIMTQGEAQAGGAGRCDGLHGPLGKVSVLLCLQAAVSTAVGFTSLE